MTLVNTVYCPSQFASVSTGEIRNSIAFEVVQTAIKNVVASLSRGGAVLRAILGVVDFTAVAL